MNLINGPGPWRRTAGLQLQVLRALFNRKTDCQKNCSDRLPLQASVVKQIIAQVNFFVWTVLQGRLQTIQFLNSRGMVLDTRCLLCQQMDKSTEHLLLICAVTKTMWHYFTAGLIKAGQFLASANNVKDLLANRPKRIKVSFGNNLWNYFPYAVLWIVLISRNDIVFNDKHLNLVRICNRIKDILWFWIGV
ncbi:hypothetical protein FRX31_015391 [Thalictrum thalictroides]|uniref:Reverse transcriptase zinc-binding domain-containing protein n=1 Tax=Thalictrum thalictroides TaxID=46969 RepID=A0A7J6WCH5_THATH|nr:hypothetical protein FRX31_015391 [Thalictrum thalictroides]